MLIKKSIVIDTDNIAYKNRLEGPCLKKLTGAEPKI